MRGSDPDAALYWLAKNDFMPAKTPRFIARRIVIYARRKMSGLADPMAFGAGKCLPVCVGICRLDRKRGFHWPKRPFTLPPRNKSNSAITAIDAALDDVKSGRTFAVPEHLRDAHYSGAKKLGHGEGYKYAHEGENHFVPQDYLGADKIYYEPTEQGVEKKIKERVEKWRAQFLKLKNSHRWTQINTDWKRQKQSCALKFKPS